MTQEEKSKRYDRALEKARQLCAYPTTKPFISDLQDLFPELKESEDDEIRERVIATIHLYYGEPLEDEAKEMIAWVENTQYAIDHAKREGFQLGYKARIEKQGEQKPAWSEDDEDMFKNFVSLIPQCMTAQGYNEYINWLKSIKNRVQPQTKSDWSEEDEDYLKAAIWYAENPAPKVAKNAMLVEWLKNIRGRVQPQSQIKQEWSEEDDIMIHDIDYALRCQIAYPIPRLQSMSTWIFNLKDRVQPQSQWKPSDTQMKALDDVISSRDIKYDVLFELWKDLNKLK